MAENILQEADRLTSGDRNADYGPPWVDLARTGRLWAAILDLPDIPADKVALCMAALKISRECNRHKRDNLTDICGYTRLIEMIEDAGQLKKRATTFNSDGDY